MKVVDPYVTFDLVIIFLIILLVVYLTGEKKVVSTFSHWFHMLENFHISSEEFYAFLEKAIDNRQLPGTEVSRIFFHEGGIQTAEREYLRIAREDRIFDICAAPLGTCFFFSWWLGEAVTPLYRLTARIPLVGKALIRLFKPETYYSIDTMLMFQGAVHSAVLEVVNAYLKAKGLRALSELERKPILSKVIK